jgi:iron complex outermembrane receptor protein
MNRSTYLKMALLASTAAFAVGLPQMAQAANPVVGSDAEQEAAKRREEAQAVGDVVVTGTRQAARTALETLSPVDVLSQEEIRENVSGDLQDTLTLLAPSFNVQRQHADPPAFVRPTTMRGMPGKYTLALVNGRRYHNSAYSQAPDLSSIPTASIRRTEILRDGASAQYGSDALAGVINVILDDRPEFRAFTQYSQYYAGDGAEFRAGLGGGILLGDRGVLSGGLEYNSQGRTGRQVQRPDAIAYQEANPGVEVRDPVQKWGQPEEQRIKGSLSANFQLTAQHELYAFGLFNDASGQTDFNWRNPAATSNVYKPTAVFPGFSFMSIFPGGFTPQLKSDIQDYQLAGGLRGDLSERLTYELGLSWGRSRVAFDLDDTVNASLGPKSPTDFYLGREHQDDFVVSADFVYQLPMGDREPLNIAFGLETRLLTYGVEQGDQASWEIGPGAAEGLAVGANGMPGYGPGKAGEWDARSSAVYVDLEWKPIDPLTLGLAVRHEDHEAFGGTTNYRLAARYQLLQGLAVRGTFSTGFRAPKPFDLYSSAFSQSLNMTNGSVNNSGRLTVDDPLAIALGAKPLRPETTENSAIGLVYSGHGLTLSVDYYRIDSEDRLTTFSSAVPAWADNPNNFTSLSYFMNAYAARTQGVDIVAAYRRDIGPGRFNASVSFNKNQTEITDDRLAPLNPANKELFARRSMPGAGASFGLGYDLGRFSIDSRIRYYGDWIDTGIDPDDADALWQEFDPMVLANLTVSYDFENGVNLKVGAENLFNTYPERATRDANRGLLYSRSAPFDTDGGQVWVRVGYNF